MPYIVLGTVVAIAALVAFYLMQTYNTLVTARNRVKNQKSQIDIELKRRFDLIPNLVETVKGYAKHESSVLENVIKARSSYVTAGENTAQALAADSALTGALTKLFALSESYPELKANANFLSLQNSLAETEQKIVYSRQFYNDSVFMLNNKIEVFPSNIVAGVFHFEKEAFFEADESDRENIKVSF